MEGFCSLLKIVQMMDRSNPILVDTSNTDATDLMIIKVRGVVSEERARLEKQLTLQYCISPTCLLLQKDVNNCKQDEHFRSCYDALVSTGCGFTEETDEAVVTYGSRGSGVPVLPPLFPTFFDTTTWSTDVKGR